jgi:deoxyadenosine/deoxycytidine kinase
MEKVYCIDGNIGAGKTTVLRELASRGFEVTEEDVTAWQPLLTAFYADAERWSFTLQMQILQSLSSKLSSLSSSRRSVFVERDPLACAIFTRNSHRLGLMNDNEYGVFDKCFPAFNSARPSIRFYIETLPETCLARIKERDRESENAISLDYLESIHSEYARTYAGLKDSRVIYLDGNKDPVEIADEIVGWLTT